MGNSENNIIGKRFEYGLLAKYWKVINLSIGILGLLLTPYLRNLNRGGPKNSDRVLSYHL